MFFIPKNVSLILRYQLFSQSKCFYLQILNIYNISIEKDEMREKERERKKEKEIWKKFLQLQQKILKTVFKSWRFDEDGFIHFSTQTEKLSKKLKKIIIKIVNQTVMDFVFSRVGFTLTIFLVLFLVSIEESSAAIGLRLRQLWNRLVYDDSGVILGYFITQWDHFPLTSLVQSSV